jgi:UDP-2,3-diacylglucosamine hydrolase
MPRCIHLASDLHLGAPNSAQSKERERAFVRWMRNAAEGRGFAKNKPATELHLVGDIFDFWHEYHHVVPKGGARVMGAIAELTDSGLAVHYHVGNHDLWTYGYLEEELGVSIHRKPVLLDCDGTLCMVGHGDGLGPGDSSYKVLKKVFTSPWGQTLFRNFHPDWGVKLARGWSKRSRARGEHPMGKLEDEHLVQHAQAVLKDTDAPSPDVFIFGHRHHPFHAPLANSSAQYLNLGDWLTHMTSAVVHDGNVELLDHKKSPMD